MKIVKNTAIFLLLLGALLAFVLHSRYGGGKPYPDISSTPVLVGTSKLETVLAYSEPIGNVAATNDTSMRQRIFFTVHPESKPENNKLLEIIDGKAVPYPSEAAQGQFDTPLGVYCDQVQRLWVLDNGNHGWGTVKLTGFDLKTDKVVKEVVFPKEIAPLGSFFNDLSISPDGRYAAIADVSIWRKNPCLVIVDLLGDRVRTLLEGHPSVSTEYFLPVNPIKKMEYFGGLADLMPGIDGIDIDPLGDWIYYAGMSNSSLYRIPLKTAVDFTKNYAEVAHSVEKVGPKPLSDGIRVDTSQRVFITDIDHTGVYMHNVPRQTGLTIIKDPRIRWADGLSRGGGGYWYLADSALPEVILQSKAHIKAHAPYYIYRFQYW